MVIQECSLESFQFEDKIPFVIELSVLRSYMQLNKCVFPVYQRTQVQTSG